MVELFAVGHKPIPEPVTARSHASPRCELPTLARLSEPDGTFTRIARCKSRYGPNPLDGICTHFDVHGLIRAKNLSHRQGLSPSPRQLRNRIEREDYSENA